MNMHAEMLHLMCYEIIINITSTYRSDLITMYENRHQIFVPEHTGALLLKAKKNII